MIERCSVCCKSVRLYDRDKVCGVYERYLVLESVWREREIRN